MKNKFLIMMAVISVAMLSACGGGGGGSSDTNSVSTSGTNRNEITIAGGSNIVLAGQSLALTSNTEMRAVKPTAMKWVATSMSGASQGQSIILTDPNCLSATFTAPPFPDAMGIGNCQTILTIPPVIKDGTWKITNTATSSNGSVTASIDIIVKSIPLSGFRLIESSVPVLGSVSKPVSLSLPFTVASGFNVSNVKYEWTAATTNPATSAIAGSQNSSITVIPTAAGQYTYNVKITADVNGMLETSMGSVFVQVFPQVVQDILGATAIQVTVPGRIANLVGSISNKDATLKYKETWNQLPGSAGGPVAVKFQFQNENVVSFLTPSALGVYGFEYVVEKTLGDGSIIVSKLNTSVVVVTDQAGIFSVVTGDVQSVSVGSKTVLTGSIDAANQTVGSGVTSGVTYSYAWTQSGVSPASVVLSNPNTKTASFIPTVAGTYTFYLDVTSRTLAGETSTVRGLTQVVANADNAPSFSVDAGSAQSVLSKAVVTLTGTKSVQGTDTGVVYTYNWTQVGSSPAPVSISNATSAKATVIPTVNGVYDFKLTLTATMPNGSVKTASSNTQVSVSTTPAPVFAYSVNAGSAQTVALNQPTFLTGVTTTQGDSAGVIYTYAWEQIGTPPAVVVITGSRTLSAGFTPTVAGVYNFRLTVTANLSDGTTRTSASDTQVSAGTTSISVSVSAGDAQSVTAKTAVILTGVITTQGNTSGYGFSSEWTQIGTSPAVVPISNNTSRVASFVPSVAGSYTFLLTVTARQGMATITSEAQTQVLVTAAP